MPPKNDDSIKKLGDKLREIAMQHAKENPTTKRVTIADLVAEGEKLLAEEKKNPPKVEIPVTAENPYLRARIEVLKKMKDWRRREVEEMEKTGNLNNSYYQDFVKEVARLGDKYSS